MERPRRSHLVLVTLITSACCLGAALAVPILVDLREGTIEDISPASWGALLAGTAAWFAFVLLCAGFWLQKSALEQQKDALRQQEHALARLAFALETQSGALMATHAPALESSTIKVTDDQRSHKGQFADRIELTLVNTGGDARDLRVAFCGMESEGPAHRTRSAEAKVQRHPNLIQGNPPWVSSWFHYHRPEDGPFSRPEGFLVVLYRDVYGIDHELRFQVRWSRSPYTEPPFTPSRFGILLRTSTPVAAQ